MQKCLYILQWPPLQMYVNGGRTYLKKLRIENKFLGSFKNINIPQTQSSFINTRVVFKVFF